MKKEKWPDLKNDNRGMTLAEMIITFALMGIFLAAVTMVISSSVVVHSELTATMYAQSVGETLLDKITGELAGAKVKESKSIVIENIYRDGETVGQGVTFFDKEGRKCRMSAVDGTLILEGELSWQMDDKAYMGYRISDFQLRRLNEKNVLEAQIKLKNLKTGFEYTTSRAVQCYQFETEEDFQKIVVNE